MKLTTINEHIRFIDDFWTKAQCDRYISKAEKQGFSEALIKTGMGYRNISSVRNNERYILDDPELAKTIWEDLAAFAPMQLGRSRAIGLNERFRIYRYKEGQQFKKHRDLSYIRNPQEASYYTCLIYLNDAFEGGSTTFKNVEITPQIGRCLLFYHPLEHEGKIIHSGIKYVLRTDIMYRINASN